MKTVREALKELTTVIQDENGYDPAFALGYIESLFACVVETLPKTQQRRIIKEIQDHIDYRKTA